MNPGTAHILPRERHRTQDWSLFSRCFESWVHRWGKPSDTLFSSPEERKRLHRGKALCPGTQGWWWSRTRRSGHPVRTARVSHSQAGRSSRFLPFPRPGQVSSSAQRGGFSERLSFVNGAALWTHASGPCTDASVLPREFPLQHVPVFTSLQYPVLFHSPPPRICFPL